MTQGTHNRDDSGKPVGASSPAGAAKLAEAALRNLHMDCSCLAPDGRQFTARMIVWRAGELVGTAPAAAGQHVSLQAGQQVVCSCKLGQEVLRFSATVAVGQASPDGRGAESAQLHLTHITEPQVVQRRRYYRIPLAGRHPSSATCWLVDQREPGLPKVCSKLDGEILDLSAGGIGVILVDDARLLAQAAELQTWVRFMVPGENESLIFRAALRHTELTGDGRCRVGLEFLEYVEPGQHQAVIERLAHYAAQQAG